MKIKQKRKKQKLKVQKFSIVNAGRKKRSKGPKLNNPAANSVDDSDDVDDDERVSLYANDANELVDNLTV